MVSVTQIVSMMEPQYQNLSKKDSQKILEGKLSRKMDLTFYEILAYHEIYKEKVAKEKTSLPDFIAYMIPKCSMLKMVSIDWNSHLNFLPIAHIEDNEANPCPLLFTPFNHLFDHALRYDQPLEAWTWIVSKESPMPVEFHQMLKEILFDGKTFDGTNWIYFEGSYLDGMYWLSYALRMFPENGGDSKTVQKIQSTVAELFIPLTKSVTDTIFSYLNPVSSIK